MVCAVKCLCKNHLQWIVSSWHLTNVVKPLLVYVFQVCISATFLIILPLLQIPFLPSLCLAVLQGLLKTHCSQVASLIPTPWKSLLSLNSLSTYLRVIISFSALNYSDLCTCNSGQFVNSLKSEPTPRSGLFLFFFLSFMFFPKLYLSPQKHLKQGLVPNGRSFTRSYYYLLLLITVSYYCYNRYHVLIDGNVHFTKNMRIMPQTKISLWR